MSMLTCKILCHKRIFLSCPRANYCLCHGGFLSCSRVNFPLMELHKGLLNLLLK